MSDAKLGHQYVVLVFLELSYYEQTLVSSPGPTQSTGEPNVRDIAIACKVAAAILFHKIISFVRAPKVQTFYWLN